MTTWASIVVFGATAASAKMRRWETTVPDAVYRGVKKWLGIVASESQAEVPYVTGKLAHSMKFTVSRRPLSAQIAYTAPHAKYVHEVQRPSHSNGKWKFLEDPWKRNLPNLEHVVGVEVRKALR